MSDTGLTGQGGNGGWLGTAVGVVSNHVPPKALGWTLLIVGVLYWAGVKGNLSFDFGAKKEPPVQTSGSQLSRPQLSESNR